MDYSDQALKQAWQSEYPLQGVVPEEYEYIPPVAKKRLALNWLLDEYRGQPGYTDKEYLDRCAELEKAMSLCDLAFLAEHPYSKNSSDYYKSLLRERLAVKPEMIYAKQTITAPKEFMITYYSYNVLGQREWILRLSAYRGKRLLEFENRLTKQRKTATLDDDALAELKRLCCRCNFWSWSESYYLPGEEEDVDCWSIAFRAFSKSVEVRDRYTCCIEGRGNRPVLWREFEQFIDAAGKALGVSLQIPQTKKC